MQNKDTSFTPEKQVAFIEFECSGGTTIQYLIDVFGEKEALELTTLKRVYWHRWSDIITNLFRLSHLQKNLSKVDQSLYEKLSSKELSESEIRDALKTTITK